MHLPLTFGDIAATIKPIPNVALTTEVQISAVGMHNQRLSYMVVLRDPDGKITEQIGPYPAYAFRFLTHCTMASGSQLIEWLNKEARKCA